MLLYEPKSHPFLGVKNMSNENPVFVVRRIRRASVNYVQEASLPETGHYRGFGSVSGETLDEFHDRMYDLDPLEAMAYEMEIALLKTN